ASVGDAAAGEDDFPLSLSDRWLIALNERTLYRIDNRIPCFPQLKYSEVSRSSSSSSFVLVRISGGTSESPGACFLDASFFHPRKPPRSPTENEGRDI